MRPPRGCRLWTPPSSAAPLRFSLEVRMHPFNSSAFHGVEWESSKRVLSRSLPWNTTHIISRNQTKKTSKRQIKRFTRSLGYLQMIFHKLLSMLKNVSFVNAADKMLCTIKNTAAFRGEERNSKNENRKTRPLKNPENPRVHQSSSMAMGERPA